MIVIRLNERLVELPDGVTARQLRDQTMPEADLIVHNGFPLQDDQPLQYGDTVVLIARQRRPDASELESLLSARHSPGVLEKVKRATVGVAGLGGLGSAVAVALARTGIGKLVLADFDLVEPSNLNRQQYFIDQLGSPKTEALIENLRRINPYAEFEPVQQRVTARNAAAVFAGCEIVAECFDDPQSKAELTQALLRSGKTVVAASGVAGDGPANAIRTKKKMARLYVVGDGITAAAPGRGLMAPRVGIAAHHQANAILRLLLGEDPCPESA